MRTTSTILPRTFLFEQVKNAPNCSAQGESKKVFEDLGTFA